MPRRAREPEPLSEAEAAELRALVASLTWKFAKTMAYWPHEYVIFHDPAPLQVLSEAIRRYGVLETFAPTGQRYRYLHLDGWRYWRLPIRSALGIINRAKVDEPGEARLL